MKDPDSAFTDEAAEQQNTPITLYEFEYKANTWTYLAGWDQDVIFDGVTYTKTKGTFRSVKQTVELELPSTDVTLQNIAPDNNTPATITQYVIDDDIRGKRVIIKTVFDNLLDNANAFVKEKFWIDSYAITTKTIIIHLSSAADILADEIPRRTYSPVTCQWVFKEDGCNWTPSDVPANLRIPKIQGSCSHRLNGSNGCRIHFEKSSKGYLPFGGFPGRPSPRTISF